VGRGALELTSGAVSASIPGMGALLRIVAGALGEFGGSFLSETFDPTPDPLQTAKGAAFRGAAGQAGGEILTKAGSALFKPSEVLIPGAQKTSDIITSRGGRVLPGLITESRTVDLLESVAEASFAGGGRVKRFKREAVDIVETAVNDFVKKFKLFGSTKLDTSEVVQDIVARGSVAFQIEGSKIARVIDELSPDPIVSYLAVKRGAERLLKKTEAGLDDAKALVKKVLKKPDNVTFEEAQILRARLLKVTRRSGKSGFDVDEAPSAARELAKIIDSAMEDAARSLARQGTKGRAAPSNPRVLKAWRDLNAFWKAGADEFNSKLMRSIVGSDADVVFDVAIKAGKPINIRRLRNMIVKTEVGFRPRTKSGKPMSLVAAAGRSKQWKAVQGEFLRRTLLKSTTDGKLVGSRITKQLDDFGEDGLRELFPVGTQLGDFRDLAVALRTSQAATQEGTGAIFIQLKQSGAATQIVAMSLGSSTKSGLITAFSIILGPLGLGRMFSNPAFSKAVTLGLKAPPGGAKMVRALAQAAAVASNFGLPDTNFLLGGS